MKTYRLKDNHPTVKKLDKLCALAKKLNLTIEFNMGSGISCVTDHDLKQSFDLLDVDESGYGLQKSFTSFPMMTEYKLTYEK